MMSKAVTNRELEKIHEEGQEAYFSNLPLSRDVSPENWPTIPYFCDLRKDPWKSMSKHERAYDDRYLTWLAWCNGWRYASTLDSIDQQGEGRLEEVMGKSTSRKIKKLKKDRMKDGGVTSFLGLQKK
jgi:hypothetical protein